MAGLVATAGAQASDIELSPRLELTVARDAARSGGRDARLVGAIEHRAIDGYGAPRAIGASITLPRGVAFHGAAALRCSRTRILEARGVGLCPRRSMLGSGHVGNGFADAAVVDGFADADFQFVNAGRNLIWAVTTIYNPALVTEPMPVAVRRLAGRRWSYRLDFRVPSVLRVVAGVPIKLRGFALGLDGIDLAPGYLTFDRACPKRRRLPYLVSVAFEHADGAVASAAFVGRLRCRMAPRT